MNAPSLTLSSFTIFDWVLVALLVASTVRAFVRGFMLEALSLIGLTAGILLASWYYGDLAAKLMAWLEPFTRLAYATADIIAFLTIVIGVMVLAGVTGNLLRSSASAIGLGLIDRLLGAAFGLARGCLIGVACMMVLTAFGPGDRISTQTIRNSHLLPYFLAGARGVSFVVPGTLQQQLADGADRIKHGKPVWIKPAQ